MISWYPEKTWEESLPLGMGGFILKNTLSDNGAVTGGVSVVDENGLLSQVHETTGIVDGRRWTDSDATVKKYRNGSVQMIMYP